MDFFNLMVYTVPAPGPASPPDSPISGISAIRFPDECEPGASDKQAAELYLRTSPPAAQYGNAVYGYDYTNVTGLFGACPNAPFTPTANATTPSKP